MMQILPTILFCLPCVKKGEVNGEEALNILVNEQGIVNLDLLDSEVSSRFFQQFSHHSDFPPVIPLLLWQNCYYFGSPVRLKAEDIHQLSEVKGFAQCRFTTIKVIPIAEKSYHAWYFTQTVNVNTIVLIYAE